ncbi:rubrerythrin family protein [Sedimentibacter sp. zth1]|uniref:rubrerythrin family protein n=1 Tax=Sedimentibacter sp. zth1 TaxID=2816908 RepID=UPI001A932B9E|nr:rubrerythrin family protein [Sedimentibacter sp. zth1]QSX07023.1 rubrerythrin family protein [Sedimentibacter sp. zth1]
MKSLMNSVTAENLINEFRRRTHCQQKYSNYAAIATEEEYLEISNMYKKMAKNCNEHARIIARFLLCNGYNADEICSLTQMPIYCADTLTNLQTTARDEAVNAMSIYPEYIKTAYDENYLEVAIMLYNISNVAEEHAKRCSSKVNMIQNNTYLRKKDVKKWACNRCGYVYVGCEAPNICPLCVNGKKYFELLHEN